MPDALPEKKIYATDAVPADWKTKPDDQKIAWLDTQGMPSDASINLGDCYRRGANLTHYFSAVLKLLKRVIDTVIKKQRASLKKYLNTFLEALNRSVSRLSNFIFSECEALVRDGKFTDESTPFTPVPIPDLQAIDEKDLVIAPPAGTNFESTFWGTFLKTLDVLVDSWPWLSKVQPPMNVSFAQLLKAAAESGQVFFIEFQKSQVSTPQ